MKAVTLGRDGWAAEVATAPLAGEFAMTLGANSILMFRSGACSLQTYCTVQQLRDLAHMLTCEAARADASKRQPEEVDA